MEVTIQSNTVELNNFKPQEWHNIPNPVIQAFSLFKNVISDQSTAILDIYKKLSFQQQKYEEKFIGIQKSIHSTNQFIENIEKASKEDNKSLEESFSDMFSQSKKDLEETSRKLQFENKQSLENLKTELNYSIKKFETLPTKAQVQSEISNANENLRKKVKQEAKQEFQEVLSPQLSKLTAQIDTSSNELKSKLEIQTQEIQNNQEASKEETQNLLNQLKNTQKEIQLIEQKAAEETQKLMQTIENYKQTTFETFEAKFENFENEVQEKIQESSQSMQKFVTSQITQNDRTQEVVDSFTQQIDEQNQEIQNIYQQIKNLEEQVREIPQQVQPPSKSPPKTPPKPPTPPLPPTPPSFPIEEINSSIEQAKSELKSLLNLTQENLQTQIENSRKGFDETIEYCSSHIKEFKDKLSWLPIKLTELSGMTPPEARLFTLEARLRSEENSRIQSFQEIMRMLQKVSESPVPRSKSRQSKIPVTERLIEPTQEAEAYRTYRAVKLRSWIPDVHSND